MKLLKTVSFPCNIHALSFGPTVEMYLTLFCSTSESKLVALTIVAPTSSGSGLTLEVSQHFSETNGIHRAVCEAVAVSVNGKFLASGGNDHMIKLWSVNSLLSGGSAGHQAAAQAFVGHSDHVTKLHFSSDGATLISVSLIPLKHSSPLPYHLALLYSDFFDPTSS